MPSKIFIPEPHYSLCRYIEETLVKHGFEAWLVGGSVRDLVLDGRLADVDYTTNATPQQVMKIFPRTVPVGIQFGTVLVLYKGEKVEVTTYRADADYTDGRRPNTVTFAKDLATDIRRRDFTVNGLAYSVVKKEFKDYCGGMADIQNKILRTIGDPVARFTEDGLRPIRGCRIAAKNAFTIEEKTRLAMFACRHVTAKVAPERFYDEWRKTLHLKDKAAFWQNILNAGIVGAFLPTIESFFSAERSGIFLREINLIQPRTMAAYAASIFYLLRITDNSLQKTTLLNTKFPTAQLKLALSLLASPLLIIDATTSRLEFKKNLMRITKLERVHHVRFAIAMRLAAMREEGAIPQAQKDFETHVRALYREIRKSREAIDMGALFINGVDIQSLGVTGRNVGVVLQHLLNKVIETPALNNRDRLLEEARHFSKSL